MAQSMDVHKPDYGIDAPTIVRNFVLSGGGALLLGIILINSSHPVWRSVGKMLLIVGAWYALTGLVMVWGSKFGKLKLRDRVLNALSLRGDEQVLDVGCGRGLMLIGAARRLPAGKATGIDLWQTVDQSGNSPEATMMNARAEGVADRMELLTGDARSLPFPDNSFDAVVSSWALHNIPDRGGRAQAIHEIVRVLKPGGQLAIIDIQRTGEYKKILEEAGFSHLQRSGPNFLFVIPTFVLTAGKP